jgi:hypothetical protein
MQVSWRSMGSNSLVYNRLSRCAGQFEHSYSIACNFYSGYMCDIICLVNITAFVIMFLLTAVVRSI